ncbi:HipA N-terminal domain-containing protein [uncultured Dokdonia sp.]|uniref:HipA N-terminal domain-containing protein n=1 Tax=uncultured Dokdonia sp. TaxID=575653 RepID=UPI00261EB314|nr:HipA N-terminal domain-containing protein [uncultured Dokdonia sp.]
MRQATILYNDILAGILTETDDGYFTYQYDENYIANYPDSFITFTMPVNETVYKENRLFPFFEGLILAK